MLGRRFGEIRLQAQRLPEMLHRFDRLALLYERLTPVDVDESIVGLQVQRLLEVFDRLREPVLATERSIRLDEVRFDIQGLEDLLERSGDVAVLSECDAPDAVRLGEIRPDAQRLLEVLDRLGGIALLDERGAPVDVSLREIGLDA